MSEPLLSREVPARAGEPPHPVLLLLHGRGADERDLVPLADALDPRLRCVSARAPFSLPGFGYQWYEMERVGSPDPRTFGESLRLAGALAERLAAGAPQVIACGFSQGAVMAAALLAHFPQHVAAAALLSGYLAVEPQAAAGRPVFIGHGLHDPVIPVGFGRQAAQRLTAAGAVVSAHEYPFAHSTSPAELADLDAWLKQRLA